MTLPNRLEGSLRQLVSIPPEAAYAPAGSEFLKTGIEALDELLDGGLPRGGISEIVGAGCSGKTALLFRILAEATGQGELVAYVDAFDCLDPAGARRSGIELGRVLWIRNRSLPPPERTARALKAADILVRSEGFGVVVLDLQSELPNAADPLARVPCNVWQRLKRLLRTKSTLLLILSDVARAGSAAALVLRLEAPVIHWRTASPTGKSPSGLQSKTSHTCLLSGVVATIRPSRGKRHGRLALHSRI